MDLELALELRCYICKLLLQVKLEVHKFILQPWPCTQFLWVNMTYIELCPAIYMQVSLLTRHRELNCMEKQSQTYRNWHGEEIIA